MSCFTLTALIVVHFRLSRLSDGNATKKRKKSPSHIKCGRNVRKVINNLVSVCHPLSLIVESDGMLIFLASDEEPAVVFPPGRENSLTVSLSQPFASTRHFHLGQTLLVLWSQSDAFQNVGFVPFGHEMGLINEPRPLARIKKVAEKNTKLMREEKKLSMFLCNYPQL